MQQFVMKTVRSFQRPVVFLKDWNNVTALLDTGALFPVWVWAESHLVSMGATLVKKNVTFGGFGGMATGSLYGIKYVKIGDLIFTNMSIVACNSFGNVPFQMILSATMFEGLIYEINTKTHKLTVTIPDTENVVRSLKVRDTDGVLHICCGSAASMDVVQKSSVF